MSFSLLPWILDQESGQLKLVEKRWRPTNLLYVSQARSLLQDIGRRYRLLVSARDEMEMLDRAAKYIQLLSRMRVYLRQAHFTWKGDQLMFVRAVAGFYSDFSYILRLIKEDRDRGLITTE